MRITNFSASQLPKGSFGLEEPLFYVAVFVESYKEKRVAEEAIRRSGFAKFYLGFVAGDNLAKLSFFSTSIAEAGEIRDFIASLSA